MKLLKELHYKQNRPIMKKIIYNTLILNLILINCYSQSLSFAKSKYVLTHHYDSLNFSNIQEESFILILSEKHSLFKSLDKEIVDSIMKSNYNKTGIMMPVTDKKFTNEKILFDFSSNEMVTTTLKTVGNFKTKRTFPEINWDIKNISRKIMGFDCQQAICEYHGRKFSVWFTNEIPIKAGPWKLVGLPGLIIEAEDETKSIQFKLISFELSDKDKINIDLSEEEISWPEYLRLAKFMQDDPHAFMEQRLGKKFTVTPPMEPMKRNPLLPSQRINFPLEALEYYTQQ
ncbi:MAG: GLPGLI family protein [Oligoflexus sp.]|nr:GLPGLI family protein [Pseudopedobacter sp.]